MEMPLALIKFRTDATLPKTNTTASAILSHISLSPDENPGFPSSFCDEPGNVLVFHERFSPALDLETIKAFAGYCKMISGKMQLAMGCGDINEQGEKLAEAWRFAGSGGETYGKDWEWWFERWKAAKRGGRGGEMCWFGGEDSGRS